MQESKGAPKLLGKKSEEEGEEEGKEKGIAPQVKGMWKKRNAAARVRREYKTAEEVLEKAAEVGEGWGQAVQQPILDMRGPQARLVTNLETLEVKEHEDDGGAVPMPELQHNLRLIVDLAENEIAQMDARLRQEKDTAVILGREQVSPSRPHPRRQITARVTSSLPLPPFPFNVSSQYPSLSRSPPLSSASSSSPFIGAPIQTPHAFALNPSLQTFPDPPNLPTLCAFCLCPPPRRARRWSFRRWIRSWIGFLTSCTR